MSHSLFSVEKKGEISLEVNFYLSLQDLASFIYLFNDFNLERTLRLQTAKIDAKDHVGADGLEA
jgi:hypothetical protein